ncbi:MAG: hypothetical protein OCD02_18675 [Spirochaetaceae bacterium]
MLNEVIGKEVYVYSGIMSYLTNPDRGIVLGIDDKWLKLETKRTNLLLEVKKINRIRYRK